MGLNSISPNREMIELFIEPPSIIDPCCFSRAYLGGLITCLCIMPYSTMFNDHCNRALATIETKLNNYSGQLDHIL
jgi:hypothetical protein